MSEATIISIGLGFVSFCGVAMAAIIKIPFRKGNSNGLVDHKKCAAHSGLVAENVAINSDVKDLKDGQNKLWDSLDDLRKDMNTGTQNILKAIGEIKK